MEVDCVPRRFCPQGDSVHPAAKYEQLFFLIVPSCELTPLAHVILLYGGQQQKRGTEYPMTPAVSNPLHVHFYMYSSCTHVCQNILPIGLGIKVCDLLNDSNVGRDLRLSGQRHLITFHSDCLTLFLCIYDFMFQSLLKVFTCKDMKLVFINLC